MRIFLLVILFFSVFFNQEIKVISYNIRYDNPQDGKDSWEKRKSYFIDYINKENPDFIGLQEVTYNQLTFINDNLKDYKYLGVGRDDGKNKGEFTPIYYKKSLFDLIKSDTFWLSSYPDSVSIGWDASMERICTYGLFKFKDSNRKIWIFNTHFDHIGKISRYNSSKLIIEKISKLTSNEDYVLLTGDFNDLPDSKPIRTIIEHMNDTNALLNPEEDSYKTFNGFKLNPESNNRIDYIFQNNFKLISSGHHLIKTDENRWVSDHNPVYANLKF
ncbi:MAG: endonuclease/exonuclease/phosphatase family protein [Flavobacteriaceae bacterium]|nr:endonuclease/exonuclease/phosphatase family protein [Flavobacteriaceae bacterium]